MLNVYFSGSQPGGTGASGCPLVMSRGYAKVKFKWWFLILGYTLLKDWEPMDYIKGGQHFSQVGQNLEAKTSTGQNLDQYFHFGAKKLINLSLLLLTFTYNYHSDSIEKPPRAIKEPLAGQKWPASPRLANLWLIWSNLPRLSKSVYRLHTVSLNLCKLSLYEALLDVKSSPFFV
jgi:hypothetical protein